MMGHVFHPAGSRAVGIGVEETDWGTDVETDDRMIEVVDGGMEVKVDKRTVDVTDGKTNFVGVGSSVLVAGVTPQVAIKKHVNIIKKVARFIL
jgi:hypothetical protein